MKTSRQNVEVSLSVQKSRSSYNPENPRSKPPSLVVGSNIGYNREHGRVCGVGCFFGLRFDQIQFVLGYAEGDPPPTHLFEKIRNDFDSEIFMDLNVVENPFPTITSSFLATSIAAANRNDGITVIIDRSVNVSKSSIPATLAGVSRTETGFPCDLTTIRS